MKIKLFIALHGIMFRLITENRIFMLEEKLKRIPKPGQDEFLQKSDVKPSWSTLNIDTQ